MAALYIVPQCISFFSRIYKILKNIRERLILFSFRLASLTLHSEFFLFLSKMNIIHKRIRCILYLYYSIERFNRDIFHRAYRKPKEICAFLSSVSRRIVFAAIAAIAYCELIGSRKLSMVAARYDRWFTRNLPISLDNLSRNYTATQGHAEQLKSESCNWRSLSETWSRSSVLI